MPEWIKALTVGDPRRSLVREVLLLQLLFGLCIAAAAMATVWWGANWAVEDNVNRWSREWAGNLGQLGAPLYSEDRGRAAVLIEDYVSQFPEIAFVRYHDVDGRLLFGFGESDGWPDVDPAMVQADESMIPEQQVRRLGQSRYLIGSAVEVSAFSSDGLLDFDPASEAVQSQLRGVVSLGLDFGPYRALLIDRIWVAMGFTLVSVIVLSVLLSSRLRSSLKPLSALQQRLTGMVDGDPGPATTTGFSEIDDVNRTLDRSVAAIQARDRRLLRMAHYDFLTGLPNRYLLMETLGQELESSSGRPAWLLLIDLDHFSDINDVASHAAGDRILRQVGARLALLLGEGAFLSRFSGDEFAAVVHDLDESDVRSLAKKILHELPSRPHIDANRMFTIHASIGITALDPELNADEVLAQAGIACQEAKKRGRNRYRTFATTGGDQARKAADMDWLELVKSALEQDRFQLAYQPILDLAQKSVSHHEVLLRLPGPDGELISPAAFIGVAERFGLMRKIDRWVIRQALVQLASMQSLGRGSALSINLSGSSFVDNNLVKFVGGLLDELNIPPELIMFEITEQVAVTELAGARETLAALRGRGIQFALDDFGAGYSSLTYLKTLPVDYIKIDGAFVENLVNDTADQATVKAIVGIAHATGKKTIAEYVRDQHTLDLLRALNVDGAQGSYVGPAVPVPVLGVTVPA
ncbi:MAG: EAL domain-containing protein [Xanthomonadales bacterium]|nr:EAL domain-containing protein [Xanthomonadales bacterium]